MGTESTWQGVFFHGPEPDQDKEGRESSRPQGLWFVYIGKEEADALGPVARCRSGRKAYPFLVHLSIELDSALAFNSHLKCGFSRISLL